MSKSTRSGSFRGTSGQGQDGRRLRELSPLLGEFLQRFPAGVLPLQGRRLRFPGQDIRPARLRGLVFPPCRQRVKDYDAWCVNPASEEFASEGLCSLRAANRPGIRCMVRQLDNSSTSFVLADVSRTFLGDLCRLQGQEILRPVDNRAGYYVLATLTTADPSFPLSSRQSSGEVPRPLLGILGGTTAKVWQSPEGHIVPASTPPSMLGDGFSVKCLGPGYLRGRCEAFVLKASRQR